MAYNPFLKLGQKKSAQQLYEENKTATVPQKKKGSPRRSGNIKYDSPTFNSRSAEKGRSAQWEKDLINPLPSNKFFGKSQNAKFDTVMELKGLSKSEAAEFREWMDAREKNVKTVSDKQDNILNSLAKRNKKGKDEPFTALLKKQANTKEKKKGIPKLIDNLKKSELGQTTKAAAEFFNPFDDVSAEDAANKFLHHKQSKSTKEVARGMNRFLDSASLGALSNVDKRVNDRGQYYNTHRKVGEGGVTDIVTSGLGYLVPGVGAAKGAKAVGLGAKEAKGFGRLAQYAKEGAATGAGLSAAEIAIREGLNPDDYNYKDNLKHLAIGTGAGAVADPLLRGAGDVVSKQWGKLAKGEVPTWTGKPSSSVMDSLPKSRDPELLAKLNSPAYQDIKESVYRNSSLNEKSQLKSILPELKSTRSDIEKIAPAAKQAKVEYEKAVQDQYEYLKNSMGKGVQKGGLVRDKDGYVTSSYGRISNNPKWYQDFYAANKRKPTNAELMDLAKKHVREGFEDEAGYIPAWKPKAVEKIDDQLSEINGMLKEAPEQEEALRPIINALEEDKASLIKGIDDTQSNYQSLQSKFGALAKKAEEINAKPEPFKPIDNPFGFKTINEAAAGAEKVSPRVGRDFEPIESGTFSNGPLSKVQPSTVDHTTGNAETFHTKVNRTPPKKERTTFNNLRTQFIDRRAPLEVLEKNITGGVASAEDSIYKMARLYEGSPEKAHMVAQEHLEPIVRSLKGTKYTLDDLGDYALAMHAKDVNAKGINSGFTNAEIDATIAKYASPAMEEARQNLLKMNNFVLDTLSGGKTPPLDPAQVSAMKEKWPNYVSLFRAFDDDKIEFVNGISKSLGNVTNPIKKLQGSSRDVIDPMESAVKNVFNAINTADRNNVAAQLESLAKADAEGIFVRKLASGEDAKRLNVISYLDKGEKVSFEVPPDVYKSIKNLDKESTNTLIKILQKPASVLRAGATLTPEFSLRNPMRDVPHAFVVSNSGFNPVIDFPVGLWQSIWKGRTIKIGGKEFKTSGKLYEQFIKENGGYGNIVSMDRKLHRETLTKALKEADERYVNVLSPKTFKMVLSKLSNPIGVMRTVADVSESATKVGEYRAALRSGASPQEAAYRARDIMDFARSGVSIKEANKVVAFLNANIQGKSKLWRAFKENPTKVIGKSVASVTLPTIGALVAQHKLANDNQREILDDAPQWLKDTFYLVPIPGTDQIARIPKPFDLAFAFSNTLERAADYVLKHDKEAFDGWIKEGFSTMSVPTMLTGVAPIVEGMANYSFFKQGPVIPQREQNMEFPDQYDVNTTETAKFVGKQVNKVTGGQGPFKNFGSPRIIDNSIQGFTGGLGTYATSAVDLFLKETGIVDGPEKPEKSIDQKPLTRAFLVNQSGSGEGLEKFYKFKEKITKARGSANQNGQEFDDEDKYKEVNAASKELSDLNKEIRTIQNSPDLSAHEKKVQLDDMIKERNRLALSLLSQLK